MEGLSLNKGCVVAKPSKTTLKRANASVVGFMHHSSETEKEAQKRYQKYQQCLTNVNSKIEDIFSQSETEYHEQVQEFVTDSISCLLQPNLSFKRIPTCILNGYFDFSLESFSKLKDLVSSITPLIINLQPPTNMKTLMKEIFGQLVQLENEEEEVSFSIPECSLTTLCEWYKSYTEDELKEDCPPVIMVIESIEEFPIHILADFITLLSTRLDELPVILIIGAKGTSNDSQLLPTSILALLQLVHISNDPLQTAIPKILEMMCFDPSVGVHIAPSVCSKLLNGFERQIVISSQLVKSTLKFYIFEHFYWQPLSFLCDANSSDIKKEIQIMSVGQTEMIRATPSMMRYIENANPRECKLLLQNDRHLKETIEKCMIHLYSYYDYILPVLDCLHYLLNGKSTDNQLDKLKQFLDYIINKENSSYIKRLTVFDTQTLRNRIQNCLKIIKTREKISFKLSEFCTILKDFSLHEESQKEKVNKDLERIIEWLNNHLICPSILPLHEVLCLAASIDPLINNSTPYHIL